MSKPTDIYKEFSRELLENFVWQLQCTSVDFRNALRRGIEQGVDCILSYSFECPSEKDAKLLEAYIKEQGEDEISITSSEGVCILNGKSEETPFDLGATLGWVGFMCDAGNQFGSRFDGWSVSVAPVATEVNSEEESLGSEEVDFTSQPEAPSYEHMVIARILDPVMPIERGEKYEDPLTTALKEHGLGEVTGGGSQFNNQFQIEYVEIEISLHDLTQGIDLSKQILNKIGAPKGSYLRYSQEIVIPISD